MTCGTPDMFHAWYSAKSEAQSRLQEVTSYVHVYVNAEGQRVPVTFVTRAPELDFYSWWDDLQYQGVVFIEKEAHA